MAILKHLFFSFTVAFIVTDVSEVHKIIETHMIVFSIQCNKLNLIMFSPHDGRINCRSSVHCIDFTLVYLIDKKQDNATYWCHVN